MNSVFQYHLAGEALDVELFQSRALYCELALQYRVEARKLVIDEREAETVRIIFARYVELESIIALIEDLRRSGIRTRIRQIGGKRVGGVAFTAGPLTYLLKNRIYIGEIVHKGQPYPGEHPAIVDRSLFEAVQAKLIANQVSPERKAGTSNAALKGKIFDDRGNIMTPRHTQKGQLRYYYYTSRAFIEGRKEDAGSVARVANNDIEPRIAARLAELAGIQPIEGATFDAERERELLDTYVSKVVVGERHLEIRLKGALEENGATISVPWTRRRKKPKRELLLLGSDSDARPIKARNRRLLIRSIARGRAWLDDLIAGKVDGAEAIAQRENCSARSVHMTLNLAFLAPDIVAAAVAGTLPRGLGITNLCALPPLWAEQRKAISV